MPSVWSPFGSSGRGKVLIAIIVIGLVVGGGYTYSKLSPFAAQGTAFDSTTTFNGVSAGPTGNTFTIFPLGGASPTWTTGPANAGSCFGSLCGGQSSFCTNGLTWTDCGSATAKIANNYAVYGQLPGTAFTPLGADKTFCAISGEPSCIQQTSTFVIGQNSFTEIRFGFVVQITIIGDKPSVTTSCQVTQSVLGGAFGPGNGACSAVEVSALNSALSSLNSAALSGGKVVVDLSVPISFFPSNATGYGIIDGWLGQSGECSYTGQVAGSSAVCNGATAGCNASFPNGGQASVNPCQGHAPLTNNLLGFSWLGGGWLPFGSITQAQLSSLQLSKLNPNAQFTFTFTSIGPQYKALCGTTNCTATQNGDCITAGGGSTAVGGNINANACFIQYDSGITVQLPVVFDALAYVYNPVTQITSPCPLCVTTILNQTKNNLGTTTPNQLFMVHVQDGIFGLPINSAQIGIAPAGGGGGCSSFQSASATNAQGNVNFSLTSGSWYICASGAQGTVTLLFFTLGITYSQNQAQITAQAGGLAQNVVLILQPSLGSAFTLIGIVAFFAIIVLIFLTAIIVAYGGRQTAGFIAGLRKP